MKFSTSTVDFKKILRNEQCEFISLGYNCDVAHFLRCTGLRNKAYPFDWCITPNQSLIRVFKHDFNDFFNIKNLTYSEPHKANVFEGEGRSIRETDEIVVSGICSKYKMVFPHDFPDDELHTYYKNLEKYNKRVERLRMVLDSNLVVFFIYKLEVDSDEDKFLLDFRRVIYGNYPSLAFYIISLDDFECLIESSARIKLIKYFNKKRQSLKKILVGLLG